MGFTSWDLLLKYVYIVYGSQVSLPLSPFFNELVSFFLSFGSTLLSRYRLSLSQRLSYLRELTLRSHYLLQRGVSPSSGVEDTYYPRYSWTYSVDKVFIHLI